MGLRSTQLTLLATILGGEPINAADLAAPLGIDQTTLSRNIDRLVAMGLVAAGEGPDARSKPLSLTPSGRAAVRRALPAWRGAQARARALLGPRLTELIITHSPPSGA